ncbi:MAG: hypothetical protein F4X44_13425 [Gammaproteobacteria bacterium]|nr:hypothetical protein [Gammaproteobacteria bacterium]
MQRRTLIIFCFLLTGFVAGSSHGLSCVRYSLEENFDRMDVVFTGTVVQKKGAPEEFSRTVSWGPDYPERVVPAVQVQFKVNFSWKRTLAEKVTVYTLNPKESNWGYDFKDNGNYLVFACAIGSKNEENTGNEVYIRTNWCYQNVDLEKFFWTKEKSPHKEIPLLSDDDHLDELVESILDRRSSPFLHGIRNVNQLNRQLALLKLKAEAGEEKDFPATTEKMPEL